MHDEWATGKIGYTTDRVLFLLYNAYLAGYEKKSQALVCIQTDEAMT